MSLTPNHLVKSRSAHERNLFDDHLAELQDESEQRYKGLAEIAKGPEREKARQYDLMIVAQNQIHEGYANVAALRNFLLDAETRAKEGALTLAEESLRERDQQSLRALKMMYGSNVEKASVVDEDASHELGLYARRVRNTTGRTTLYEPSVRAATICTIQTNKDPLQAGQEPAESRKTKTMANITSFLVCKAQPGRLLVQKSPKR